MKKLLEMLGVEKLDEDAQSKIKEKLDEIVTTMAEIKAKTLSEAQLKEEKEKLIKEYEDKFEEYKEDITSKFSNFVDGILDEEMTIPESIIEFAKKGELYHDLIEQFKIRLSVDEGLLDEEVKNLLKEAKEEIVKLRSDLDEKTAKELELELDAQKLAAELYLRKKTDGLTESQKTQTVELLEGITDRKEIDRKFDIIVESLKINEKDDEKDDEEEEEDGEEGKGKVDGEKDEDEDEKNESGPFQEYLKNYTKILKENKI